MGWREIKERIDNVKEKIDDFDEKLHEILPDISIDHSRGDLRDGVPFGLIIGLVFGLLFCIICPILSFRQVLILISIIGLFALPVGWTGSVGMILGASVAVLLIYLVSLLL